MTETKYGHLSTEGTNMATAETEMFMRSGFPLKGIDNIYFLSADLIQSTHYITNIHAILIICSGRETVSYSR